MPAMWHVKIDMTQVFDIVRDPGDITHIHTDMHLTIEFDLDHTLTAIKKSVVATVDTYGSTLKQIVSGQTVTNRSSAPRGKTVKFLGARGRRKLKPCGDPPEGPAYDPNVDKYLLVPAAPGDPDQPGAKQDGAFEIEFSVSIPVRLTNAYAGQKPTTEDTNTAVGGPVLVQYDPAQSTNSTVLEPPSEDVPWCSLHTIFNDVTGGKVSGVTNTAQCTVTTKPLALVYTASAKDVRSKTDSPWGGAKKKSETLTFDGNAYVAHANNRVQPMVDGADASKDLKIYRCVRSWVAPLAADGTRSADYSTAIGSSVPAQWLFDNEVDGGVTQPGWYDIPAFGLLSKDPSQWPRARQVDEFVSGVYQFPEFGFIYYAVVWEIFPDAYRIKMYPETKLSLADWCARKANSPNQPLVGDAPLDTEWRDHNGKKRSSPY